MDHGSYTRTLYFHPARQPLSKPLRVQPQSLAPLLDAHHNRRLRGVDPPGHEKLGQMVRTETSSSLAHSDSVASLATSWRSQWPPSSASLSASRVRLGESAESWENGDPCWATGGIRRRPYVPRVVRCEWTTESMASYGQPTPGALPRARSASSLRPPMHQAPPLAGI